ncbi:Mob protein [Frigidibacter albus]|uniref:Mob protein n=1 Tax=Frigidibacter albus TaxID=1465486 RepID=A0A6L8VPQ1_9RHOB|nr:Mob protein [Frigidibacter albus]MZQ91319.1 Mob protein [Frigidibacter albus]NBE33237.1 Mob protein [Frigidibacter albus]GGH63988.1 hypothetical protein GCM10011341_39590 [Frigidibacter albus]
MAYQYVHVQTYSNKLTKVQGTKDHFNSINQVFEEADRNPLYSGHVPDPQPPISLMMHGAITVTELRKLHDTRRSEIRETVTLPDGRIYNRALKSDFPTLYTEIHSHPMRSDEYREAAPDERAQVKRWASIAVGDFAKRMSEGVQFAAVVHLDEGHVHIHILAVNIEDPKMSASKLHVGKVAAAAWRDIHGSEDRLTSLPRPEPVPRPKKPKKPKPSKNRITQKKRDAEHADAVAAWEQDCARAEAANADLLAQWEKENGRHLHAHRKERKKKSSDVVAYQAAMAAFQDHYHEAVGKRCGLLRNGPGNERLSTKQYADRKANARLVAADDEAQRLMARKIVQKEQTQKEKDRAQAVAAEQLTGMAGKLEEHMAATAAAASVLAGREAAVAEREEAGDARDQAQERTAVTQAEQATALRNGEARLATERSALQREQLESRDEARARDVDLDRREQDVAAKEQEVADAVEAIGDMVEQMERGEIVATDGKLELGFVPRFVERCAVTPPDARSPVQHLVAKFVGLLKRVVTNLGGGSEPERNEPR